MLFLSTSSGNAVKTHTPTSTSAYNVGAGPFQVVRVNLGDFEDLERVLRQCPPTVFAVRGETVDPGATTIAARSKATIRDAASRWVPVDYDAEDAPDTSVLSEILAQALDVLPEPFSRAGCLVQASASTGLPGKGARARLWFLADKDVTNAELKAWLTGLAGVDTAPYHVSQPIYTAAPIFRGVLDPCAERFLLVEGPELEVPEIEVSPARDYGSGTSVSPELAADALDKFYRVLRLALPEPLLRDGNLQHVKGKFAFLGGLMWQLPTAERERAEGDAFEALKTWYARTGYEREWEELHREVDRSFGQGTDDKPIPADMERSAILDLGAGVVDAAAGVNLFEQVGTALVGLKGKRTKVALAEKVALEAAIAPHKHPDVPADDVARALVKYTSADPEQVRALLPNVFAHLETVTEAVRAEAAAEVRHRAEVADHKAHGVALDKEGRPTSSAANTLKFVRQDFGRALRRNVRGNSVEIRGIFGAGDSWTPAPAAFGSMITEYLQDKYGIQDPRGVKDAVGCVADATSVDPWLETVLGFPAWDGVERVQFVLSDVFGCPRDEYHTSVAACWMRSIYARAVEPGCKVDEMLTLVGAQGTFKSTFFKVLVGSEWVVDAIHGEGKDIAITLAGAVIYENAELQKGRREASKEKAFLSSSVDVYRAPYAAAAASHARRWVCAGSTNEGGYLTDFTGNRRHWPVRVVHQAKLEGLDVVQLWAEVRDRWTAGEKRTWLTSSEFAAAELVRAQFMAEDPADEVCDVLYDLLGKDVMMGGMPGQREQGVLVEVRGVDLRSALDKYRFSTTVVSRAMSMMGWTQHRKNNGRFWTKH